MLLRRALLLGDDNPQARGTADTATFELMEDVAPYLRDRRQQLLLDGAVVGTGRRRRLVLDALSDMDAAVGRGRYRLLLDATSNLDAAVA